MCMCEAYKTLSKRKCARVHHLRERPLKNLYWFVYRNYSKKYDSIVNMTYYWFLKRKRRGLRFRFQIFIRYISILGHYFFFGMFYYLFLYDVTLKPEDLTKGRKRRKKNFHPDFFRCWRLLW